MKVEEKYFRTKFRPAIILLSVNGMAYFKLKIQLKYKNNKYYSYIIVNFRTGLCSKYFNVNLKFRTNKSCNQKRTVHWQFLNSLLLKPLKQRLPNVTSFRLSKSIYSRSVLFKRSNNSGSVFRNSVGCRIYKTKLPTNVSFLFLFFNFLLDAQPPSFIRDCGHVIALPVTS